jgi:mono/diheme cytochrome c family protein
MPQFSIPGSLKAELRGCGRKSMKREVSRPNLCATLASAAMLALLVASLGTSARAAAGKAANGQKLYASQGCAACHAIGGKGGKVGPDLSKEGKKRNATWLAAFLKNPRSKIAKGSMPPVKASSKDLQDLSAYLLTLK